MSQRMLEILSGIGKAISASHTRPNNADAYTALDVVGTSPATNIEFADVSETKGGLVAILSASMRIDVPAIPAGLGTFRLHLYNAVPTAIADNAAYNLPVADRAKYLGYVELFGAVDNGDTVWLQVSGVNLVCKLASESTALYGILQTLGAYTPTAQAVKTITLNVAAV